VIKNQGVHEVMFYCICFTNGFNKYFRGYVNCPLLPPLFSPHVYSWQMAISLTLFHCFNFGILLTRTCLLTSRIITLFRYCLSYNPNLFTSVHCSNIEEKERERFNPNLLTSGMAWPMKNSPMASCGTRMSLRTLRLTLAASSMKAYHSVRGGVF
jgi:hypothetical protein